jgi:Ser/Thr protein kinase RdoA (MazF antagonist)
MRSGYERTIEAIVERAEPVFRSVPVLRLHGDFYGENCLRTADGFVAIDFDDMMSGPAAQDVWVIARTKDPAETRRRMAIVAGGYRAHRAFAPEWIELFPALHAMRFMWIAAWITSRWFDPKFRATFPDFGTHELYARELARIRSMTSSGDP